MARDIKLNSQDWCDVVFNGKNKQYGAYKLRSTSTKRQVLAFIIVLCFVGVVGAVPYLVSEVKSQIDRRAEGTQDVVQMVDVEDDKIEDDVIIPPVEDTPPPPPPVRASIQFTPPVIVPNEQVTEENEIKDQNKLNEDKGLEIGNYNVLDGSRDPNALSADKIFDNAGMTGAGDGDGSKKQPDKIFEVVEQMPDYPGGRAELMRYLGDNIKYPTSAAELGIEGQVILQFVVEKNGSITDIKVVRTLDPACDKEAVRVVKSMQNWVPGRQNGQSVRVQFTLPIKYKLNK
ncbi:energy transducer TonB [Dysgonomonas sp. 520]|uniref:energy transducer TonB n=1 Tax=Dysgonomonas sp. 520 TaxID=2302931 RepID=UPI0013D2E2B9|nr:energy transducer TonB [Dysgonomonas sp. 520]NDW09381.1 energy transducer TonB [Dysgonomonas sp. 520]